MENKMFPIKLRPRFTSGLVESIQSHFGSETGEEFSRGVVERSLTQWMEARYDLMLEGIGEMLTSPHLAEAQEFKRILEENAAYPTLRASASEPAAVPAIEDASVFSGKRVFSTEKLGAMISYIANRGEDIYKTNLNKLLFYGDMTFYYLYGQGMSGATYLNRPYGPVPSSVETVIDDLAASGVVTRTDMPEFGGNAQKITSDSTDTPGLSVDEIDVLDWVLNTYGHMSASELSELSHQEKAYKFTRPLEPIAYEYAKFLNKLPPKAAV